MFESDDLDIGMQVLTFNGIGYVDDIQDDCIIVDGLEYDISEIQAII